MKKIPAITQKESAYLQDNKFQNYPQSINRLGSRHGKIKSLPFWQAFCLS